MTGKVITNIDILDDAAAYVQRAGGIYREVFFRRLIELTFRPADWPAVLCRDNEDGSFSLDFDRIDEIVHDFAERLFDRYRDPVHPLDDAAECRQSERLIAWAIELKLI